MAKSSSSTKTAKKTVKKAAKAAPKAAKPETAKGEARSQSQVRGQGAASGKGARRPSRRSPRRRSHRCAAEAAAKGGWRQHLYRDRRLDVRALARRVLPGRTCRSNRELEYAAAHLTSIEINGTFYRTQTPATVPQVGVGSAERLKFSVKGVALRHQPAACWRKPATRSSASSIPAC